MYKLTGTFLFPRQMPYAPRPAQSHVLACETRNWKSISRNGTGFGIGGEELVEYALQHLYNVDI